MSAASIRMGGAEVEIGANLTKLRMALNKGRDMMQSWGKGLQSVGAAMFGAGAVMGAALVPALLSFADYDQALANLRAAASPDALQFEAIKNEIETVAKATGDSLPEVTNAFAELIKAGRTIEEVVGGLGEATVKFARIGMIPAADAAKTLVMALNLFSREGVTASDAMSYISQAADTSLASIKDISDAFANVGSVASGAGHTLRDTATALGLLANAGLIGAEGGTALRTVLTRLTTGSDGAQEALDGLGVSAYSSSGQVKPLIEIIEDLQRATAGMSEEEKNIKLFKIAGAYGQNALKSLMNAGRATWDTFQASMAGSMTTEEKFAVMTNTLWGSFKRVWVHVQLVAVAIGEALAPSLRSIGAVLMPILDVLAKFIKQNKEIIQYIAIGAVGLVAFGAAIFAIGTIIYGVGSAIGVVTSIATGLVAVVSAVGAIFGFVFSPIGLTILAIVAAVALVSYGFYELLKAFPAIGAAFTQYFEPWGAVFESIGATFSQMWGGIVNSLMAGDFAGAFEIMWLGIQLLWTKGINWLAESWTDFKYLFIATFGEATQAVIDSILAMVRSVGTGIASLLDLMIAQVNAVIDRLPGWLTKRAGISRIETSATDLVTGAVDALEASTRLPSERDAARESSEQRRINRGEEDFLQAELDVAAIEAAERRAMADRSSIRPRGPSEPGAPQGAFGMVGSFSGAALAMGMSSPIERTAVAAEHLVELTTRQMDMIARLIPGGDGVEVA